MRFSEGQFKKSVYETYEWHPLMANVATKAHKIFLDAGLVPEYRFATSPLSPALIRIHYMDKEALTVHDKNILYDTMPARMVIFRNNGLAVTFPNILILKASPDTTLADRINLHIKETNSLHNAKGILPEMTPEGSFEEKRLEFFLNRCLHGSYTRLNPDNNNAYGI